MTCVPYLHSIIHKEGVMLVTCALRLLDYFMVACKTHERCHSMCIGIHIRVVGTKLSQKPLSTPEGVYERRRPLGGHDLPMLPRGWSVGEVGP